MTRLLTIAAVILSAVCMRAEQPIKVACIGNSITYGFNVENREMMNYPAQLQRMLGEGYVVGNFGRSGATLLKHGHRPYVMQPEWKSAKEFTPDIAVIHLGINDTDPRNWPEFGDEFVSDYKAIIDTLRIINPDVRVLVARLTPLNAKHYRFKSGTRIWRLLVQEAIENVAKATGAEVIDFNIPLRDRQNLMPDGIHPNAEGATLLAQTAYSGITGNYGGLKLPAIYQSGMVMQRNRYLPIAGTADAGSQITLTLGGATYRTIANNRGQWLVTAAPLVAGPSYAMTVTDGKDTIHLTDILAGELWIASGQSNMEFPLNSSINSLPDIESSADPMLRIYDMKPIDRTNDVVWSDSIIEQNNKLKQFHSTKWQQISPTNAGELSAVAYYFARQLRDSLQVPVGVISNAIGGSPTESWVDINTLEAEMPEILVNWQTNDYVQKWVQDRSIKNIGKHKDSLHPYKPAYLFSSAIRPLGQLPIAGVIWYQGESNAHNAEVYERLFSMLVNSWRKHFCNDSLPFYFVQLSSINRPSWPAFRNKQRLLSKKIPNIYMAVSSDVGDSLDVHPRNKRPVGQRLARQALVNTYGFSRLTPSGPEPVKAESVNGRIILTMTNANGMHTSDGNVPATFEVAEIDGLYHPAQATIIDNKIVLYNMNVKLPRFVRYGWQPFTRANLVNSDNLPTSTFKLQVDNADDFLIESGMECGVSAPFAGMIGQQVIMAGGCNFPTDPMAPTSQKKFYKGIYAADSATMQWQRIGSLPQPMAYGATASTPDGLVLIGGTSATQSLNTVYLLSIVNGNVDIRQLPSLPCTIDNMAAAAIGNKIYVVGGNVNGTPSRQLIMLDLDAASPQWKTLKQLPGNPRVQPAMAATNDRLWLWGGFAPKHDNHQASLEVDGLCYNPADNKWTTLPAPTNSDGVTLSTGGGAACTLSDGRIAVCGGVNKDVFLEALRNQAPDYLQHPIEWYAFNPSILLFDPATLLWHVFDTTPEAARAGAAIVAGSQCDFFLLGGELKPRIRTSQTLHVNISQQ